MLQWSIPTWVFHPPDTRNSTKEVFMERAGMKHKYLAAAAVVMSLMVLAVPILAQQSDLEAGRTAGAQSARATTKR